MSAEFMIFQHSYMRSTEYKIYQIIPNLLIKIFLLIFFAHTVVYGEEFYISAYWAKNSPDRFLDILRYMDPDFRDSYLISVTGSRILSRGEWINFELEGQAVIHYGKQHHLEINSVFIARWMKFPWDKWIDTRIAFGEGLSYALRRPYLEPRKDPEAEESAHLLNYLLFELEFIVPGLPKWSKFIRVHHRSGVLGLFGGVVGGSNFIGAGLRYYF